VAPSRAFCLLWLCQPPRAACIRFMRRSLLMALALGCTQTGPARRSPAWLYKKLWGSTLPQCHEF
jgi:hypothetical protein